jgi:6-phosphogluconolactonase/glucosamine-6-phosphate isomerase/deaminase
MNYVATDNTQPVIDHIVDVLSRHLEVGEKVLWLLSGGSNILTAVETAKRLQEYDVQNLTVSLVDERYGPVGHVHENWQQLIDAGFHLEAATLHRPLTGASRKDTAASYNSWLGEQFGQSDYSLALMGIGADGHTSGIKSGSPAATASGWVTDYSWEDYERITTTFDAIKRLDEVVVAAIGIDKWPVIRSMLYHDIDLSEQPAQVLKQVKKSTLYTDYKEE